MVGVWVTIAATIPIKLGHQEGQVRIGVINFCLTGSVPMGSYIFYSKLSSISGARLVNPIRFFFSFEGGIALAKLKAAFSFYSGSADWLLKPWCSWCSP